MRERGNTYYINILYSVIRLNSLACDVLISRMIIKRGEYAFDKRVSNINYFSVLHAVIIRLQQRRSRKKIHVS